MRAHSNPTLLGIETLWVGGQLLMAATVLAAGNAVAADRDAVSIGVVRASRPSLALVVNRPRWEQDGQREHDPVLVACDALARSGRVRILDVGAAYQAAIGEVLAIKDPESAAAEAAFGWCRDWLSRQVRPDEMIVLVGDETVLPTRTVRIGRFEFNGESLYSDLNADGLPDTAMARVIGTPEQMIRQLRGKATYGNKAAILCSEDTRIHLETRAFAGQLSEFGYEPMIRGARDDVVLAQSDFIVHFGHGSSSGIANRFGESFADISSIPELPLAPIVFVDGCATLPVGSPLLRAFLDRGAIAYCGSTETVFGMVPSRFTNELVEHFLRLVALHPGHPLPWLLMQARAAYVQGHAGLQAGLATVAVRGKADADGDELLHLVTVLEWVYYGDPRASIRRVGQRHVFNRQALALDQSEVVRPEAPSWKGRYTCGEAEGSAVLAAYVDVPADERSVFRLGVYRDGERLAQLDGDHDTVYQRLGRECRGGHVSGDLYRARFLVPLGARPGEHEVELRLEAGRIATVTAPTSVDVWPPGFEKEIGLRLEPPLRTTVGGAGSDPVRVEGEARMQETGVTGVFALDLSGLFNRPHNSMGIGGGDNASFRTWFEKKEVATANVPFRVQLAGNDVIVSPNNTENLFQINELNAKATAIHFLVWGYSFPTPARLRIRYEDDATEEHVLPLSEWTREMENAAFDFKNTVRGFRHAGIAHEVIRVRRPEVKIRSIESLSGRFGLIAVSVRTTEP